MKINKGEKESSSFFFISAALILIAGIFFFMGYFDNRLSSITNKVVAAGAVTPTANLYVRDGGTGTTCTDWGANACDTLPAILQRGATYYIADGFYGSYTFDDPVSGTQPITVKKATIAEHGTATGWDNTYGDGTAVFSGITFTTSYWVFDGVTGGGTSTWNSGKATSGFGFEVTRTPPNVCGDNGNLVTLGASVSNIIIKHANIHAGSNNYPINGIKGTNGASNIIISDNAIYTTFGPAFHIGTWSNAVIERNYIADVRNTGATDPRGFCANWHAEGISSIGTNNNLTVRHNLWDRIDGTAVIAGVNVGTSNNWKVYGNIFSRSVTPIYYYFEPSPGTNRQTMNNLEFYNNNIVNMLGGSQGGIMIQSGSNNRIYNNIWYNNIANSFAISGTHDYNFFSDNRRTEGCNPACDKDAEGAAGEANAQTSSGDPFAGGSNVDPLTGNFHLKSATNRGTSLPSPYDVDPDNAIRGVDGVWDRGAYEYVPSTLRIYYVAQAGNDANPGTLSQPWKTIQKAANTVQAGDTVIVSAGTYNERVTFSAGHSGSAGKKITFIASPLKSVIMQGFDTTNANYLRIEGFNITGSPPWWKGGGVWLSSNNVEIVGNYFYDLIGAGVLTFWDQNKLLQNTYIANNHIYHSGAGIYAVGNNVLVENNEVERLYTQAGSPDADYARFFGSNITFRNNFFHGTQENETGASHVDCFQTYDVNGEYAQHVLIENNACYNYDQGLMVSTAKYRNSYDFTLRNNVFAHSLAWGLSVYAVTDVKVYNNVFADVKYHGVGFGAGATGEVKNNIFYNAGSNYWADAETNATVTGGYNILYPEHYPWFKTATDIIKDPLFVDAANDNFHLKSNSPAINAGTVISEFNYDKDGTSRLQGTAWDIGAYEYATGAPPTATYYIRSGATGLTCADWGANACNALPATLQRGAIYYIADGSYGSYTFDDPVSGTQTITIKKATVAEHGTSTGWSDSYGDGTAAWGAVTFSTSYWVFDGATGGGHGSWTSGHGFTFSSPAGTNVAYVSLPDGVSNIIVRHSSFTQTGNTEATTIGAHAFYAPGTLSNSLFEYNYFENLGGLPFLFRNGAGNVIQYNWLGNICGQSVADVNQHCEALVLWDMDDVHFRWNYIGESPSSGGFVKNANPTSDSIRIYGNVFRNGFPINCNTGPCTNWRIFNNAFVTGITGPLGGDGARSGFLVYNNIIRNANVASLGGTHDYNWYSAVTGTSCSMQSSAHENVNKLYPGNCDTVTETLNPFVNINGATPESLKLANPLSGNPGTDVCALDSCTGNKFYNLDAFGNIRGADGVWDRGAYEYTGSSPLSPPAGTFYIRDGATGTTCTDWGANACDTLPAILQRGATYYIADGSYGSYTFDDPVSGTQTITIKKATLADHGTNTGWQSSYGDGVASFSGIRFSTPYYTFDGVVGSGKTGHGFEVQPSSPADAIVLSGNVNNIVFRHINAHIYNEGTAKTSMTTFTMILKATTGTTNNIIIEDSYFHHVFGCQMQVVGANNWIIQNNYMSNQRSTAEQHAALWCDQSSDNVIFRNNMFVDIEGTSFIDLIEGPDTANGFKIYNNLFWHSNSNPWGASVSGVITVANDASNARTATNWEIYGNSIVNIKGRSAIDIASGSGNDVKNNYWFCNRQDDSYTNYMFISGAASSYNYYSACAHPYSFSSGTGEPVLLDGPNSKLSANSTNPFMDWPNGDFTLRTATWSGANLPSPYNTDLLGNIRGADGVWDRGAYEFAGGATPPPPSSRNWYLRSGATGNGSSWTNAWGSVGSIAWSSIQPGDTLWIAGGTYGSLVVGKSGNADTDAGRIFIKRATQSAHGSDTGWSSSYDSQVVFASISWTSPNVGSYVTVDGQVDSGIRVATRATGGREGTAVFIGRGQNYITLRNMEMAGPCGSTPCMQGGDNRALSTTAWSGSSYELVDNLKVQYSKIHGACTNIWLMNADNAILEYNEIYNSHATDTVPCHPNVVATSQSSNVIFRYNKVHDYATEGIMMLSGNSGTWYVYGNLWYAGTGYARVLESQDGTNGPVYFYGNTMVDLQQSVRTANNGVWHSASQGRNNIYWNASSPGLPSESNNIVGSGSSSPFVNYAGRDYHLTSTSAARNAGATLTNDGFINKDLEGNTRGADGAWDIGAYEYISSGIPPLADNASLTLFDDFGSTTLDSAWLFTDPLLNSNFSLMANPGHLQVNVPAGSTHDCWPGTSNCVRMLRSVNNADAVYETKIDGVNIGASYQTYGIMLSQDSANYLRFEFWNGGSGAQPSVWRIIGGSGSNVILAPATTLGSSNYIRVTRTGSVFQLDYSTNGMTWTTAGSFTQSGFTVNQAGVYVINAGANPATTGNFDYFSVAQFTPPPPTDTTPPVVRSFVIPATATSLTVPITAFTATDNVAVTGYLITETATAPAATATGWTASAPASYTFASAGAKTLYAWAKDAAGKVSAQSASASATTLALPPSGDIPFASVTIDANNPVDPHNKAVGDINGDGFVDVLAAGSSSSGLYWYEYPSWTKRLIASGAFTTDMETGDIDGDGDVDVVIPNGLGLMWYKNPRPLGNPATDAWTPVNIGGAGANNHDVELADLNKDGKLDVVSRPKGGGATNVWLQNTPTSWTRVVASTRAGEGTALGDIDGDGDVDIAHNGFWLENLGNGASWSERNIDVNWPLDVGVHIADINKDGRNDVVLAPSESGGRFSWYESINPKTGPWTEHAISSTISYAHTFKSADMDKDGKLDLVTAEMHQSSNDEVSVWRNNGGGLSWTKQVVVNTGSHNLRLADIGNDGDIDIVGANWNDAAPDSAIIRMWRNDLNSKSTLDSWQRSVADVAKPARAVFIRSADLDSDGKKDLVTGGWWYKNPGTLSGGWTRKTIGAPLNNIAVIYDFDSDGDLDLLGTQGVGSDVNNRFAWARNDGKGNFTVLTNIATGGSGDFLQGAVAGRFSSAGSIQVALSWHNGGGGVQMLTVPADPSTTTWTWKVISTTSQDEDLSAGDIDRDGDLDLLLGTQWLHNDGSSWTPLTLFSTTASPDRNRLSDINRDGRLDSVVGYEAISVFGKLAWYEQPLNPTNAWTEHVIANVIGPMSLDVADMDFDGDLDVVVGEHNLANSASAKLYVFENVDTIGGTWSSHVVYTGDEHHDGTQVADLDSDGDPDIYSIGWNNNQLTVYENKATVAILPPLTPTPNNFYVRPKGNVYGSGNGLDWNNAWSDVTAINWNAVSAGDTIWIAGGSYGVLTIGKSGTAGNPIKIYRVRATDPVPTSAAGWSASYDSTVTMVRVVSESRSYWTLDGRVPHIGISVVNPSLTSHGVYLGTSNWSGITLTNLLLSGPVPDNTISGVTEQIRAIHYNGYQGSGSGLTVSYSTLEKYPNLALLININNVLIEHNKFQKNYRGSGSVHPGVMSVIGLTNVKFRFNEITEWQAEGIMMDFIGAGDAVNDNWDIYGNLWHDSIAGSTNNILTAQYKPQTNIRLYSNTVVNSWLGIIVGNGGSWASSSISRNNLIYFAQTYTTLDFPGGDNDYNYGNAPARGAHSISNLSSNVFANYAGRDYRIVSTIGAGYPRDKGVALGSLYGVDFAGNTRIGAWDIGAYEYTGITPLVDTTPPIVTSFSIPSTSNSLTVPISLFTATDNVAVTGYLVTETATAPAASAAGWTASAPPSYTFSSAGAKTLYAWAKDAAGKVSASASRSVTITLPPETWKTYYVDYDSGSDSNNGLSASAPWKHAPGDSNAVGNPKSKVLAAGDTVLFKGSVKYQGSIALDGRYAFGATGNPITLKGDGWGSGKAVIDGSEPITAAFKKCQSSAQCAGNPNWNSMYYADIGSGYTFETGFYEDDNFLWYAQDPNPTDPFNYDRRDSMRVIPKGSTTITQTRTSITDPTYFTQSDPAFWNSAYVIAWRVPNVMSIKKITGYNPATRTISHEDLGGDLYDHTSYDSYYAILNHPSVINAEREYSYDQPTGRFYLWPKGGDISGHTYSVRKQSAGIYANSVKNLVIEGFGVQKFTFGIRAVDGGSGITPENVVIRNNEVRKLKSNDWYGIQVNGMNISVENNKVTDAQRAIGILVGGNGIMVRNNFVQRTSRNGIWFMGAANSQILNNTITEILGTHANSITVYQDSQNILVANNKVFNSERPLTFERSQNLTVINNLFDGRLDGKFLDSHIVADWGNMTGAVNLLNNVIVGSNRTSLLLQSTANFVVKNNIIGNQVPSGSSALPYTNNIFTNPSSAPLSNGNIQVTDLSKIFVDPISVPADYRLKQGSAAIDKGGGISSVFPSTLFAGYEYAKDFAGTSRPKGSAWDIGAYESSASGANWYVDNLATGKNDGTSWANAWKSFGSIVWGASGVKAGDTLHISGGTSSKVYHETLAMMSNSGTANAWITISVGQDAGHNGQVIVDGDNIRNKGISIGSYTLLTGKVGNSSKLTLRNFVVNQTGNREVDSGTAIWAAANTIIEYTEINHANNGIYAYGQNTEIRNSYLHDIWGDFAIRAVQYLGTDFDNIRIHHNTIEVNGDFTGSNGGPDGVQSRNGLTMNDNVLRVVSGPVNPGQHPDGVQAMGSYNKIYNNYFANFINSGIKIEPFQDTAWEGDYIYNNIITVDSSPLPNLYERGIEFGAAVNVTSVKNVLILNNNFIDLNFLGINGGVKTTNVSNVVIRNNVFHNTGRNSGKAVIAWNDPGKKTDIDYNLISPGSDGGNLIILNGNWSSSYVQAHPRAGTPSFLSYSLPRNRNNNFHLATSDTAARDLGMDASAYFNSDKDGVIRPQGSAWDIGAYEYNSSIISAKQNVHYIRAGAAGANDGSDWANAYFSFPANLVAGDTYYVAGGNFNTTTIRSALTSTSWTYIKKATASSHGTGTGWSDSYGGQVTINGTLFVSSPYLDIDGVTGADNSGYGIKVVMKNCNTNAQGIYIAQNQGHIHLSHIEVQGCGEDIPFDQRGVFTVNTLPVSDQYYSYLWVHDLSGNPISLGQYTNNFTLEYSRLERMHQIDPSIHGQAIQITAPPSNNITIRYNKFIDTSGTAAVALLGANGETFSNIFVYDNLFWSSDKNRYTFSPGAIYGRVNVSQNNVLVYNNIFYSITNPETFMSGDIVTKSDNKNNIYVNSIFNFPHYKTNSSNNLYFNNTGKNIPLGEPNQISAARSPFVNAPTNFYLASNAEAIDKGVALSQPYNVDILGTSRPQGSAWDIGAYEYTGESLIQTYSLTVTSMGNGFGIVTCGGTTCPSSVSANTQLTFVANPSAGSVFSGWSGACAGTAPACTLKITATTSVTASFAVTASPDTTPPSIFLTAPVSGDNISGGIVVSARATDPIVQGQTTSGIASVQFKIDGLNLGPMLTMTPYGIFWNASTATAGSHVLSAAATDAAGNNATAIPVVINVTSYQPPDSDDDGVPDNIDKCRHTPSKMQINIYGCPLPIFGKFTPALTVNFSAVDLTNFTGFRIGVQNFGQIDYGNRMFSFIGDNSSMSNISPLVQIDMESLIQFQPLKVIVNSEYFRSLNAPATVTLMNISNITNPVVLKNGVICTECRIRSFANSQIVFDVQNFSEYSVAEGSYCGDNYCSSNEDCSACQSDCGACPAPSGGGGGSSGGGGGGSSGGGGGGGGGGTPGFVCNMDWQCTSWGNCISSWQIRQCEFVKVPQYVRNETCSTSSQQPSTSQQCASPQADQGQPITDPKTQQPEILQQTPQQPQAPEAKEIRKDNKNLMRSIIISSLAIVMLITLVAVIKTYKSKSQAPKLEPGLDRKTMQQLNSYVKTMRNLGKEDNEIKKSLLKVGWKEKEVEWMFRK
ncbi:VCBS repeat-containing protein [Candidatus Woesearchaeota archaeon]|nr:VCBS repeat-containing protein [Candidatus Woesearchaeota archaeon]